MLTFTKQDSIIIAATLGVALSVPLSITAWFPSTDAALLSQAAAPARNGNLAGPLAKPEHGSSADANLPPTTPKAAALNTSRLPVIIKAIVS